MGARLIALLALLAGAGVLWIATRRSQSGRRAAADVVGAGAAAADAAIEETQVSVERMAELVVNVFMPRGIRNRNPGNIRWLDRAAARWRGMISADVGGYGIFDEIENGIRAVAKELLLDESRGVRTVRQVIGNWAPPNENDTAAYVAAVARALAVGADESLSISGRLPDLIAAISRHENGRRLDGSDYLSAAEIAEGIRRAAA